ncbi:hypothetical protein EJC49_16970 [Aquibium carbonis]|uniref:O-antigen ligase n=1 Tax=Aquibium carbonis TaxID=2495581 RepID=A0A429YUR7_9HYPH|nr:hypothetical protein [Aquibium carbonis]RST85170.1 hypothetical protein EJC49_16970 [Aquibium carbonis]
MDKFARPLPPHPAMAYPPPWLADRREVALRFSVWTYAPLLAALMLRIASGPTADLSYVALAAYALAGRPHALRALAMSWLFSMISTGIAPDAAYAAIGRYAVLGGAALSMLVHGGLFKGSPRGGGMVLATILLGLFLVLHSYFISPMVDVSVLKAVSWAVATTTILSAWTGLTPAERDRAARELFGFLVLVLLVSLPLLVLPLGYLRNGTGFQGVLNHPQAFGPTMALLGAWAAARLLGEPRPSWSSVGLLGLCLFAVLASEARTAGFAMVLGIAISMFAAPGFSGQPIRRLLPGLRSTRLWTAFFAALLAGLVLAPLIADRVGHYITKSGRAGSGSIFEVYDRSRGRLINQMTENIIKRPLTGNGFGIASEPALMQVKRDPILGLPIGASIEKGVLPLAIIEEVGISGALLVVTWFFSLMRNAGRGGIAPFAVGLTAIILNFGEATLFSAGGLGLLLLLLLGWGGTSARPAMNARHLG